MVGARIHIRVDAEGDRRRLAHAGCDLRQGLKFGFRFHVYAMNAGFQRQAEFAVGFADTGEYDAPGRNACGQGTAQFTFRNDIHACTKPGQRRQHGLVGIRLHGVADHRVETGESFIEDAVMAFQRGGRIAVERRSDGVGQCLEVYVLGMQDPVPIGEMVHGRRASGSPAGWPGLSGVRRCVKEFRRG